MHVLNVLLAQVRDEFRTDYDPGRGGYGKGREKVNSHAEEED